MSAIHARRYLVETIAELRALERKMMGPVISPSFHGRSELQPGYPTRAGEIAAERIRLERVLRELER